MALAVDRFVELRGLAFHYLDWGGAGRPVVLLHGLASTAHIWDFVAPLLAQRHRVVALDQRGHGLTDKPETGYDYASVVGDLLAFLDHLAFERAAIVGHSWGASVAVEFAAAHPERTEAIVLVDGGVNTGRSRVQRSWEEYAQAMAPPDLTHLRWEDFLRGARQRWSQLRTWTPELEAVVASLFEVTEAGTIRPRFPRAQHMQVVRAMWEHRETDRFPALRCPVLLMPCRRANSDERAQEFLRRREEAIAALVAAHPHVTVRWMEDSVHDVPLQRPELVAETILAFLEQSQSAQRIAQ